MIFPKSIIFSKVFSLVILEYIEEETLAHIFKSKYDMVLHQF